MRENKIKPPSALKHGDSIQKTEKHDFKIGEIARDFLKPALAAALTLLILVTSLIFLTLVFAAWDFESKDNWVVTLLRLGPLGDYVGGFLNPMVALSALVGLIMSVKVQRQTLHATRMGLREQLDQDNFFVLLANREAAIESLQLSRAPSTKGVSVTHLQGRAAIREVLDYIGRCAKIIENQSNWMPTRNLGEILRAATSPERLSYAELNIITAHFNIPEDLPPDLRARIRVFALLYGGSGSLRASGAAEKRALTLLSAFKARYGVESIEELLGHIFRSTYQVLKFAYRSEFSGDKKKDLVNYLRAQMSEAEFAAFALTALTSIGAKSRAASIAFDLYEKRLLSTPWARPLALYFDSTDWSNWNLAKNDGFTPLRSEPGCCHAAITSLPLGIDKI